MEQLYDFETERVKRFLLRHKAKLAAIQLPAGLRENLPKIMQTFEEVGVKALVLAGSCYGACDLADVDAKRLGCNALVHYGHADMGLPTCLLTLYVEARMKIDPSEIVNQFLPELKSRRVGLVTTVQHIGHLKGIADLLSAAGIDALIGEPGPRAKYPGQILGCDWGSAKSIAKRVDSFMYIGTGKFHPLGIALGTGKSVVALNPLAGTSRKLTPNMDDFLRSRKGAVAKASACNEFGILVSTKPGQARFSLAEDLIKKFKKTKRTAHLLVMDELVPERLGDFRQIGAFVCCACPRIPIDDAERFDRPVLTPFEARVILGETDFEPYQLDEIQEGEIKF